MNKILNNNQGKAAFAAKRRRKMRELHHSYASKYSMKKYYQGHVQALQRDAAELRKSLKGVLRGEVSVTEYQAIQERLVSVNEGISKQKTMARNQYRLKQTVR